jgi:hypothetical protein
MRTHPLCTFKGNAPAILQVCNSINFGAAVEKVDVDRRHCRSIFDTTSIAKKYLLSDEKRTKKEGRGESILPRHCTVQISLVSKAILAQAKKR